jgi:hypothetical protein
MCNTVTLENYAYDQVRKKNTICINAQSSVDMVTQGYVERGNLLLDWIQRQENQSPRI